MAVKVMLAPAIAQRLKEAEPNQPAAKAEPRPKRRPSSVYDHDGNEVYITLMCLKCHKLRPLSQFGLRKMADGTIRNQPWCRPCRSGAGTDVSRRRKRGSAHVEDGAADQNGSDSAPAEIVDAGKIAALVVAALNGGRK